MKNEVCLEIKSWRGISIGAIHWYGELCGYDKQQKYESIRLERKLTERQAATINIERRKMFPGEHDGFKYRAGMKTESFESAEEVRETAKKVWRRKFPNADQLVEGLFALGNEKTILAKAKSIK